MVRTRELAAEKDSSALPGGGDRLESFANTAIETFKLQLSHGAALRFGVDVLQYLSPLFAREEIAEIVVPSRTLARRIANKELLTVEETDRALRLARVGAQAERVFGSSEKAGRWLHKPSPALSGQTPLSLLRTETGAQLVIELLGQIAHGMFA